MKTITDALKNFYVKLGGDVSKLPSRTTSADLIDAMSDVYTDKEGTHVEVTTQVTEGTKIATIKTNNEDHDIYAPAGGGVENFIIKLYCDNSNNITSDKTAQEIADAVNDGKILYITVYAKGSTSDIVLDRVMMNRAWHVGPNNIPEIDFIDIGNGGDMIALVRRYHMDLWGVWSFEGWYLESDYDVSWPTND